MAVASDNFFGHIDDFFNYRQDIYEISPQTVKSNRVDLNLFKNFICSQNLQTINGPAVIDFQFPPVSVHCPWGFAPRHQRNGSTPT